MSERAQYFRSSSEAESARPDLDRECAIALKDFSRLVARYRFHKTDYMHCQVDEKGNGTHCNQEHGDGWVAKRVDGKEGYIGHDCANRHFGADTNYSAEARRVDREIRIDELILRIQTRQSDTAFLSRLNAASKSQTDLRAKVSALRDKWPDEFLKRIQDMMKTANRAVTVGVHYVEKDEKGRVVKTTNQPVPLGAIASPDALDLARLRGVADRISVARDALDEAKPSREQSERTLRYWIDSIDELERCEAELIEATGDLARFVEPSNLKLLCWAVRRQNTQDAIIGTVLELTTGRAASSLEVEQTRRQWSQEIRDQNGNRDFYALA